MTQKIKLVVIGKVKEKYLQSGISEYIKRLRSYCKLEIVELKDDGIDKEASKLSKYLGSNTFILDEKGIQYSSKEFSNLVKTTNEELTFIIGGANGIKDELKKNCISLSKMTFTHEMSRLFFLEQLYRAFMIINNRNYHK